MDMIRHSRLSIPWDRPDRKVLTQELEVKSAFGVSGSKTDGEATGDENARKTWHRFFMFRGCTGYFAESGIGWPLPRLRSIEFV